MKEYDPSLPLSESGLSMRRRIEGSWDLFHTATRIGKRLYGAVALFSISLYPSNTDKPELLVSSIGLTLGSSLMHYKLEPWLKDRHLQAELEYYNYQSALDQKYDQPNTQDDD